MTTFSLFPTYYQVTWTQNSPADYTSLTGDQGGGLDSCSAWDINRLISVTGTTSITGTPLNNGDSIIINGYTIDFSLNDALVDILEKINLASKYTYVCADTRVAGTYITLFNKPGTEGKPFYLAVGKGSALSDLGFTANTYRYYPAEICTKYTSVTTDSNITINGVNIIFTTGNLASAVTQLNTYSPQTGVAAYVAGPYLQLASISGQPWSINSGNAVSNLGTTTGNHGGFPSSLANSQAKERANMRWTQAINELESFSTPLFFGDVVRTGNVGNVATSSISFTIGYEHPYEVTTATRPTEPDSGNVLVGTAAIKRAIARALTSDMVSNRKVFDPTLQSYGAYTDRPNAARIQTIKAQGIDTEANILIVEGNIEVVQLPNI